MNLTLLLLFFIPVLCAVFTRYKWKHEITLWETSATFLVGALVVFAVWQAGVHSESSDTELLNGAVVRKYQDEVSCSHDYKCHCTTTTTTDSKGHTHRSEHCDTCYEHFHDYDWVLDTTIGKIKIDRVDRQGTTQPARWTAVLIGEHVAKEHSYTNYLKAVPDNILDGAGAVMADASQTVPQYPSVYDVYRVNHVISVNAKIPQPELDQLNYQVNNMLSRIGGSKQVNVNVVITQYTDSYQYAIAKAWQGGKKNDVTILVGAPEYPKIEWVEVQTWVHNTGNEQLRVALQDDLMDNGKIDITTFVPTIEKNVVANYNRPHNKDYEYLADKIEPPTWVLVLGVLLSIAASLGIGYYFSQNQYRD